MDYEGHRNESRPATKNQAPGGLFDRLISTRTGASAALILLALMLAMVVVFKVATVAMVAPLLN